MNIPRLRFPEFPEEWKTASLGEISDVKTGPFGSVLHQKDYVLFGTPIITVEHLNELGILHKNLPLVSDEDKIRLKSYLLREGDIVFSRVGSVDRNSLISSKEAGWLFSGRLLRIRFNKENSNSKFISAFFQKDESKDKVRSIAVGQTMPSINTEILKSIRITFPTLIEQTKIALFFSNNDDKISRLIKKKSLLEQYKKGVMQQLFSQELRFKDEDGNEFLEWKKRKIKDVFRFKQGIQCGVENQYTEKGQNMHRFIRIIDLTSANEPIRYINSPGVEHHIKQDDLFMVRYGTPGLVGYGFEGIIANNLFRIIPNIPVINKFYFFVFNFLSQELSQLASSSTMPALSFSSLEVLSIPMPSLPEQQKIAAFLSALDEKIAQTALQIEKMQLWKKGLLQQMFV